MPGWMQPTIMVTNLLIPDLSICGDQMSEYSHRQNGTLIKILVGIAIIWCLAIAVWGYASGELIGSTISLVVGLVLIFALVLFGSLTVQVTRKNINAAFGVGWIQFNIDVSKIQSAETVRNHWIYGWGIRWIPRGRLYNVSGFNAVELEMENGRRIRIGTDEPERLKEAIKASMREKK